MYCPYILKIYDFPLEHVGANRGHTLKGNWFILFQQLCIANSSSASSGTSYLPPLSVLGSVRLEFTQDVTMAGNLYEQMPSSVWRTLLLCCNPSPLALNNLAASSSPVIWGLRGEARFYNRHWWTQNATNCLRCREQETVNACILLFKPTDCT